MTEEQYRKNLNVPCGNADVILDTDAYNEIDDQFAIAYLLRSSERLHTVGICAAPFLNPKSKTPEDGMEKSFQEIQKVLALAEPLEATPLVFRGSSCFLPDECTPVISDAATFMASEAEKYSPEHPLYIVAIGAPTNVASAFLLNPGAMRENTVIVCLGGHAIHWPDNTEFNLQQDVAAARIIFGSGAPFVQIPCNGVVSAFRTTEPELRYWLAGRNKLADYLVENTVKEAESYAAGKPWSRPIWDVTAVGWLLNDNERFMRSMRIRAPIPQYDFKYSYSPNRPEINYVYHINRDALYADLFEKLV